jgi:hypothetical protein
MKNSFKGIVTNTWDKLIFSAADSQKMSIVHLFYYKKADGMLIYHKIYELYYKLTPHLVKTISTNSNSKSKSFYGIGYSKFSSSSKT